MNPLRTVLDLGQSVWLDFLSRRLIASGDLAKLIEEDGVTGVTSNPAIFEKAIAGSDDYDADIARLGRAGHSCRQIYDALVIDDVRRAADILRTVYEQTDGDDGFVSLEISPHLARDAAGTVIEASRLWAAVERPNLLVKVPGTEEGLVAFRELVAEGINVNVTLLFDLDRYRQVARSYLAGIETRMAAGRPVGAVTSVASFFLSRIDTQVDRQLKARGGAAEELLGKAAVASAKVAYRICREVFGSGRFRALKTQGARPQRLLWASTGTKDPAYSDVKYVEPLIGRGTISTMPAETLAAYRDHGRPAARLGDGAGEAERVLRHLGQVGVDLQGICAQLEEEGIEKFVGPFDRLLENIQEQVSAGTGTGLR